MHQDYLKLLDEFLKFINVAFLMVRLGIPVNDQNKTTKLKIMRDNKVKKEIKEQFEAKI